MTHPLLLFISDEFISDLNSKQNSPLVTGQVYFKIQHFPEIAYTYQVPKLWDL